MVGSFLKTPRTPLQICPTKGVTMDLSHSNKNLWYRLNCEGAHRWPSDPNPMDQTRSCPYEAVSYIDRRITNARSRLDGRSHANVMHPNHSIVIQPPRLNFTKTVCASNPSRRFLDLQSHRRLLHLDARALSRLRASQVVVPTLASDHRKTSPVALRPLPCSILPLPIDNGNMMIPRTL